MQIWMSVNWLKIWCMFGILHTGVIASSQPNSKQIDNLPPKGFSSDTSNKRTEFRHWGGKRYDSTQYQQTLTGPDYSRMLDSFEILKPLLTHRNMIKLISEPSYESMFWSRLRDPESLRRLMITKLKSTQKGSKRQGFNSWAGKRSFNSWAGKRQVSPISKRSVDPLNLFAKNDQQSEETYRPHAFNPWAGKKRSISTEELTAVANNHQTNDQLKPYTFEQCIIHDLFQPHKRQQFNSWAGKRVYGEGEFDTDEFNTWVDKSDTKRHQFNAWAGKRNDELMKREFNAWAGKRNIGDTWHGERNLGDKKALWKLWHSSSVSLDRR